MSPSPTPGTGEDTLTKGNGCLAVGWIKGGQRTLSASVNSQLPSAQNNPYHKVAYSVPL